MPPGLPGGFFVLGGFYPGSDFNKRALGVILSLSKGDVRKGQWPHGR